MLNYSVAELRIFSLQLIDAAKSFVSIFNMLFRSVVLYSLTFFMQIVAYNIAEFSNGFKLYGSIEFQEFSDSIISNMKFIHD